MTWNRGIWCKNGAYIEIDGLVSKLSGDYTISILVKPMNVGVDQLVVYFPYMKIEIASNGNVTFAQAYDGSYLNGYLCISDYVAKQGEWLHIVGVHGLNEGVWLYLNGVLDAYDTDKTGTVIDLNEPLKIGSLSTLYPFVGQIAMLHVWDRKLTEDEIWQLYQNPDNPPRNGLMLWMPFTEGMGVVCKDKASGLYGRMLNCKWVNQQRRGWYFDNGGLNFYTGLDFDYNYCSVVCVFKMNALARGGTPYYGRCCVIHPGGDKCMIWNETGDKYIRFTNYDGLWKAVPTNPIEPLQVYIAAGVMNGNEEHIYLASNGEIIDHNYRTDLGDCGNAVDKSVQIGSTAVGGYKHHGEVLATMIYNRPLTEEEIKQISKQGGWLNPPTDGLISWIVLDGVLEGETPVDKITGATAVNVGTPKPVIRKALR